MEGCGCTTRTRQQAVHRTGWIVGGLLSTSLATLAVRSQPSLWLSGTLALGYSGSPVLWLFFLPLVALLSLTHYPSLDLIPNRRCGSGGRNGEGGTEDAYAMGELAKAWTEGLESPRPSLLNASRELLQVIVTLKHLAVNSLENTDPWTCTMFNANETFGVANFQLADYYLRPFKAAVEDADARGIMCSYNSVLNKPTCLSPLLRNARMQWGFQGYVTSDSDSIASATSDHHYTSSAVQATALGLTDGQCDINSGNTYQDNIANALATEKLTVADVDRALFNSLKQRFDLGLFDPEEVRLSVYLLLLHCCCVSCQ